MDNNLIGAQITKFRKAAGLTQEELGRAAGVSTQAVSRWECGGTWPCCPPSPISWG